MRKDEFLLTLQNALAGMPRADLERTVQYYREMIEDRVEEGMSEEAAVADVGDPVELAAAIRKMPAKRTAVSTPKEPKAPKERKPMSAGKKLALAICAALLICAGVGLILATLNAGGKKAMEKEYTFANAGISSLEIESGSAGVMLRHTSNGVCTVRCAQGANREYKVWLNEGTLHIEKVRKWSLFPVSLTEDTIEVYLPDREFETLWIRSDSGEVSVPEGFRFDNAILMASSGAVTFTADVTYELNVQSSSGGAAVSGASPDTLFLSCTSGAISLADCAPGEVAIHSTSGSVKAERVHCKSFESSCTSGSQRFSGLIAEGQLRVDGTSGSVKLSDCDAAEVSVEVVSGSVSGNFLTPKQYDLRSVSGSVSAPASAAPTENGAVGRCTVRTTSGSIRFD